VGFANINHVFLIIVTIYGCYFPCHTPQWHLKTTAFQTASATLHFALPATVMATFSYWRQVKMITNYNQQDATFLECIYFYRCSTCFRQFLRSSSGAHNCTYSFRYCQAVCIVICSWWWAEEPPETCRVSVKINKLKKRCIVLAVICNHITMHGYMNMKKVKTSCRCARRNSWMLGGRITIIVLRWFIPVVFEIYN